MSADAAACGWPSVFRATRGCIAGTRVSRSQRSIRARVDILGFPGTTPDDKVEKTIEALRDIDAEILCPMHCTGMQAIAAIARAFPGRFVFNCAGTELVLEARRGS